MATFSVTGGYSECRPAFVEESEYRILCTLAGAGSIASWAFAAALYRPDGTPAPGTCTASVVGDGSGRQVQMVLAGQQTPGWYGFTLRRTDDGSNLVVAHGVVDITDPK